ncbi:MAG: phenylalanine--tRNA ligase subunit beta, partial [Deltaproteobacteria bacterium]|nr:phenylalanine--tRNA ligase subunit beta [Deltaproteobacteria bacterium]
MKISLEWLKDYVDLSLSPLELADLLTHAGLEVEDLVESKPGFQRVVVARLVSLRPHPQSNHLHICQVSDGKRDYTLICGAPNVKAGERVALALEGASLPDGTMIHPVTIQGILSEGMLCSEKELGLGEDASGIMFLDPSLSLGTPLDMALPLHDWMMDINVTPNRADCLCVLGVAREVAALTGKSLRYPDEFRGQGALPAETETSVVIERPDLCPRYVAQLVFSVKIGPAPFWMRRRLQASGVRAINNIVDITNYVMLETGQPLHAFDFDRLEERRIVVRSSLPRESFTTLDGVARSIPDEGLFICDGKKPVALAGIMGGLNSEVEPATKNILLESAYFDPLGIRRTSKTTGLSTEASIRFEKGIDPNGCGWAAERAAALMVKLGEGSPGHGIVDNYPRPIRPQTIGLRPSRVNQILGVTILPSEMHGYIKNLGLDIKPGGADSFQVAVPTFRVDLQREIDLIEEIARLHGFQKIPVTLPAGQGSSGKKARLPAAVDQARNLFVAFGFREVINYSFIGLKALQDLKLSVQDPRMKVLRIQNPLSEDQAVMRTTLIPGLLQAARGNFYRQNTNLRFFEVGRAFFPREGQELPTERESLAGLLTGFRQEESWAAAKEEVDFFDLKGILQALLEGLRVPRYRFFPETKEPFLHPGKACRLETD